MEYKARITVYASIGQVEQIKELAYNEDTSLSDYICRLIDAHLSKQRGKAAKHTVSQAPAHVTPTGDAPAVSDQTRLHELAQGQSQFND